MPTQGEHHSLERLFGKRALVTGGAGFIGSHLCEALVAAGCEVISFDDYSAGKAWNLRTLATLKGFTEVHGDIRSGPDLEPWLARGIDFVFHNAASKKNICLRDPARDLSVNASGTLNLLQLAVKHNVKKFVHASTGSVYGEPKILPTDETHPLDPVSYYGVSKLAGEKYVLTFATLHRLDATVLRYFHVYGPRQESNQFGGVVAIFLRNVLQGRDVTIFGDGSQVRSLTWVGDVVQANLLAAVSERTRCEVYNCGSGIRVSVQEIAEKAINVADALGLARPRIVYADWQIGDILDFDISNAKIRAHLDMRFATNYATKLEEIAISIRDELATAPREPRRNS